MKPELIGKTVQEAMILYPKRVYVLVKDGVRQTVKCCGVALSDNLKFTPS